MSKIYTSVTTDYDNFLKQVKDLQQDYIDYFVFNNKRAGVRLRKQLKQIIIDSREMSHNILETKKFREEIPYNIPKRRYTKHSKKNDSNT